MARIIRPRATAGTPTSSRSSAGMASLARRPAAAGTSTTPRSLASRFTLVRTLSADDTWITSRVPTNRGFSQRTRVAAANTANGRPRRTRGEPSNAEPSNDIVRNRTSTRERRAQGTRDEPSDTTVPDRTCIHERRPRSTRGESSSSSAPTRASASNGVARRSATSAASQARQFQRALQDGRNAEILKKAQEEREEKNKRSAGLDQDSMEDDVEPKVDAVRTQVAQPAIVEQQEQHRPPRNAGISFTMAAAEPTPIEHQQQLGEQMGQSQSPLQLPPRNAGIPFTMIPASVDQQDISQKAGAPFSAADAVPTPMVQQQYGDQGNYSESMQEPQAQQDAQPVLHRKDSLMQTNDNCGSYQTSPAKSDTAWHNVWTQSPPFYLPVDASDVYPPPSPRKRFPYHLQTPPRRRINPLSSRTHGRPGTSEVPTRVSRLGLYKRKKIGARSPYRGLAQGYANGRLQVLRVGGETTIQVVKPSNTQPLEQILTPEQQAHSALSGLWHEFISAAQSGMQDDSMETLLLRMISTAHKVFQHCPKISLAAYWHASWLKEYSNVLHCGSNIWYHVRQLIDLVEHGDDIHAFKGDLPRLCQMLCKIHVGDHEGILRALFAALQPSYAFASGCLRTPRRLSEQELYEWLQVMHGMFRNMVQWLRALPQYADTVLMGLPSDVKNCVEGVYSLVYNGGGGCS